MCSPFGKMGVAGCHELPFGMLIIVEDDADGDNDSSQESPIVEEKDPVWTNDSDEIVTTLGERAKALNDDPSDIANPSNS